MDNSRSGWEHLNGLASQYHKLVQQGEGTSAETRSMLQIEIANMITASTLPLLKSIAGAMLKRGYTVRDHTFSLAGINIQPEDLVQEGVLEILRSLKNYDPARGSLCSFINEYAAGAMYRAGLEYKSLLHVGERARQEALLIVKQPQNIVDIRMESMMSPCRYRNRRAALEALYGEIEDIWAQPEGYLHNHLESRIPVQAKESYIEPEDQVGLEKALSKALASLEGIHKKIIEEHFLGEEEKTLARIGREHHLSRERIRQLKEEALQTLQPLLSAYV